MAMYIRNTHRLLTVDVTLRPSRSGTQLTLRSFHGRERLVQRDLPAESVGIVRELSVEACRGSHFAIPEETLRPLADALRARRVDPDEPLWLQIGPSAGHLAMVPWERLIQPVLQAALLRIPNFLADPVFLTGKLRLALVVSSPRAKEHFPVYDFARAFAQWVQAAVPHGTEIHLFTDLEAYSALRELPASSGQHTTFVHDPHEADAYGTGGTLLAPREYERLESPWLRWIEGALRGRAVDAVHFLCPGYFRSDQGALALARSPSFNRDREWSHFISASELMAFLDRLGAWSVGFSPPDGDVWAIGLRLLADRLAWQRPGALLLHDMQRAKPEELIQAYAFLFQHGDPPPPASPNLMLYAHPRRMERYRGSSEGFESVQLLGMRPDATGAIPEQFAMLSWKANRSERASEPEEDSDWKQSNQLQLDQMLLRLGDQDNPSRRGMLDAMQRVEEILRRREA